MNVPIVTSLTLALTLVAPASAVLAGDGYPYTGPNKPVMTTASNETSRSATAEDEAMQSDPAAKQVFVRA